jgi:hypothetical protein
MKSNYVNLLVVVFFIVTLTTQCVYEETPEPVVMEDVSFSDDIMPIFEANCNSSLCHDMGGVAPDLSTGNAWNALQDNYLNVLDPESSLLVTKMDGGTMAPYSTDQDIATIIQWIREGANNN